MILHHFKEEYLLRQIESEKEKLLWAQVLPIFYYNDILIPGAKLSLHLFEPRYRVMMKRIVDANKSFAYVPNFANYCASIGDVALVAKINEVEFTADGRCLLEATLTGRFLIRDHFEESGTQGLHHCELQPLADDPLDAAALAAATRIKADIKELLSYFELPRGLIDKFGPLPDDLEHFSLWVIAALTRLPGPEKASYLSSTATVPRLEKGLSQLQLALNEVVMRSSARDAAGAGPPAEAEA